MKKIPIICLMIVLTCMPAMADGMTQLSVWMKDGNKVAFALEEKPKITFTESELIISTKENNHYALENIAKFTYEQIPADVRNLLDDTPAFLLDGQSLLFPSLKANSTVSVSSLNGTTVFKKTVKSDGEYAFPLANLQAGVYLVSVNGLTCKIVKK